MKGTGKVQFLRYWTLAKGGIYFVEGSANPVIQFLDLAAQRVTRLGTIRRGLIRGPRGMAVSPDGSEILYMEEDLTLSDIMLIEHVF